MVVDGFPVPWLPNSVGLCPSRRVFRIPYSEFKLLLLFYNDSITPLLYSSIPIAFSIQPATSQNEAAKARSQLPIPPILDAVRTIFQHAMLALANSLPPSVLNHRLDRSQLDNRHGHSECEFGGCGQFLAESASA